MVSLARCSLSALFVLTVDGSTFAQLPRDSSTGVPSNLDGGAFQSTVEAMWRFSPTFRNQCTRLAAKPRLRVSVRIETSRPISVVRARTEISRVRGTLTRAEIVLLTPRDAIELIAHEIEHIIEQLDGLRLSEAVCESHQQVRAGESCRAIEAGKRVAKEVKEGRRTVPYP
jgi:hypothetical protein